MTDQTITAAETGELTFEQAFDRLAAIAERLGADAVPVSEMCDLFAEGKGLERALAAFLDGQRARLAAIESGAEQTLFRITS